MHENRQISKKKGKLSERRVRVSTQGGWSQITNFGHCRVGCRRTQQHQVTTSDLALSNDDECDNQVQKIVSRTETQYRGCSKLSTLLDPSKRLPIAERECCRGRVLPNAIKGTFVGFLFAGLRGRAGERTWTKAQLAWWIAGQP